MWLDVHITEKELLLIVIACALWGRKWRGRLYIIMSAYNLVGVEQKSSTYASNEEPEFICCST